MTPSDEQLSLASLAAYPPYLLLQRVFEEHEAGLLDILAYTDKDEELVARARRWQIFRQYRNLLKEPERVAEDLRAERDRFAEEADPMRDPLAPFPPDITTF